VTDPSRTPTVSLAEAAARIRCSYHAAHDLLLRGELQGYRLGRNWRVVEASVERMVRRHGVSGQRTGHSQIRPSRSVVAPDRVP